MLQLLRFSKLRLQLGVKTGVNLEETLIVYIGSKIKSKNSVLGFLKCIDGSILAFLKCMDGSVVVWLKFMDGFVLAYLRFSIQSAPTLFPQLGNSSVP